MVLGHKFTGVDAGDAGDAGVGPRRKLFCERLGDGVHIVAHHISVA